MSKRSLMERLLQSIGKRTFVNCFEARTKGEISTEEIRAICLLDSDERYKPNKWRGEALSTRKSNINRIFQNNMQCQSLEICSKSSNIPNKEKATQLYKQYC